MNQERPSRAVWRSGMPLPYRRDSAVPVFSLSLSYGSEMQS